MKKVLFVLLVVLVSVSFISAETMKPADSMMKKDDSAVMMKADADSPFGSLQGLGSQVVGFTNEIDALALAKTQTVIYFFGASWCPDCKATFKDISVNFAMIPKTVTIIIVNYDKAAELKKKYGVAMQHTFVVIDAKAMKKSIWNGTKTVKDILAKATPMM